MTSAGGAQESICFGMPELDPPKAFAETGLPMKVYDDQVCRPPRHAENLKRLAPGFGRVVSKPPALVPFDLDLGKPSQGPDFLDRLWHTQSTDADSVCAGADSPRQGNMAWKNAPSSESGSGTSEVSMQEPMKVEVESTGEDFHCASYGTYRRAASLAGGLPVGAFLPTGAEVVIDGLTQQEAFNGRRAIVDFFDVDTGRYVVVLLAGFGQPFGNAMAHVKRENLRLSAMPPPQVAMGVPEWL